ncbi:hypothetical protein Cyrtocomes_01173 [Candidatus Cyrtobacter comes]|uniref:Uncharacterized protein n=1 Tax=Candidatus Cyrtobacter comes TaxID=675776 RepID=A0ABU5L9H9_9RICK|nr:hypothetical protein [Candidatus Cyrtobacter comes]MDZ5762778.1 hypothetical protein [Candidatus Cyrtobacter comes]
MEIGLRTFSNWSELFNLFVQLGDIADSTGNLMRFQSLKNLSDADYFCVRTHTEVLGFDTTGYDPSSMHSIGFEIVYPETCIAIPDSDMRAGRLVKKIVIFNRVFNIECVINDLLLHKCVRHIMKVNFNCIFSKEIEHSLDILYILNEDKMPNIVVGAMDNDIHVNSMDLKVIAGWNIIRKLDPISTNDILNNLSGEIQNIMNTYKVTFKLSANPNKWVSSDQDIENNYRLDAISMCKDAINRYYNASCEDSHQTSLYDGYPSYFSVCESILGPCKDWFVNHNFNYS